MRIFVQLLLASLLAIGCAGSHDYNRNGSTSTDDMVIANNGDGTFSFNFKLPENHTDLVGKDLPSAPEVTTESPYIKIKCEVNSGNANAVKVALALRDYTAGKNYVASAAYACRDGLRVTLTNLTEGHKYELSAIVYGRQGLIFKGSSEPFTTESSKISIKMTRIKKDSSIDVEIVFPTEDKKMPSSITCHFGTDIKPTVVPKPYPMPILLPATKPAIVAAPAPDEEAGNLEDDVAMPAGPPGGSCTVYVTERIVSPGYPVSDKDGSSSIVIAPTDSEGRPAPIPPPKPIPMPNPTPVPPSVGLSCGTSGASCKIDLGVLKEISSYRVEIKSKGCRTDSPRYVTLRPGQSQVVHACLRTNLPQPQPPLPTVQPENPKPMDR